MPSEAKMYTIGTDIEVFLRRDNQFVSAIPYTNGTKKEPEPLPSGGFVSYDNVALEFGVQPAITTDQFLWNIGTTLRDLLAYLPDDVEMVFTASGIFHRNQLKHKDAQAFGCDPDFCAWSGVQNSAPARKKSSGFRSCGGHVHVGHIQDTPHYEFLLTEQGRARTVFAMDMLLGLVSTFIDTSTASRERKKLYGKAGCFRTTSYGLEYRTLSNFWIKSPDLVTMVHRLTDCALEMVANNQVEQLTMACGGPARIQRIISEGLASQAEGTFENILYPMLDAGTRDIIGQCLLKATYDPLKEWKIK